MTGQPISPPTNPSVPHQTINWRQEYLHLAVIAMTACWIAPWVALSLDVLVDLSLSTAFGLSAAHLLISMILVRWLLHRRTDGSLILLIVLLLMWAAAGLTVLVIPSLALAHGGKDHLALGDLFYFDRHGRVPAGPLVIFWVLVLWWRGYQLGSAYMSLVRASFGMRLGILALFWAAILAPAGLREDMVALVPFFFFFGLVSSSLARADSLSLDRAGRATPFGRGWIISLVTISLALTLGGYVIALWIAGMDTSLVARAFAMLAEGIVTLILIIISPLLLLLQVIYNFFKSILPDKMPGTILDTDTAKVKPGGGAYAPWLADVFNLLGNALLVAVIVFITILILALLWFLFVARGEPKEYENEDRESLGTGEIVGGLRSTLRESWRRLADALGIFRQFGLGRDFLAALTIRRIYSRMERLAGQRGYPRTPAETPYEYRRELHQAFPGLGEDIRRITEAYVAVRYGEVPETDADLVAVRDAWEHLQSSAEPA